MFEIICVTSRLHCREPFLDRILALAEAEISGVILREKDLDPEAYRVLAEQVLKICSATGAPCALHTFAGIASDLGSTRLHLSLRDFREQTQLRSSFQSIGVSVHSPEEAKEAQELGADYVTAGHVFATDCKKGLEPRGTGFLQAVCAGVTIPVYAIGGISPENIALVRQTGAQGACVMSSLMQCEDVSEYLGRLRRAVS